MKLLSNPKSNTKIAKNIKQGVLTAPLHLAPYDLSGFQVCPMASTGCAKACLNTAGRGKFSNVQQARIRKTQMYFNEREEFLNILVKDVASLERKAIRESLDCGVRLNATSDIPFERVPVMYNGIVYPNIMDAFPNVKFMDYTKILKRVTQKLPSNYKIVFSQSESNVEDCKTALFHGINVATVFKDILPDTWLGHRVIDGDAHDWRYGEYELYPNTTLVIGLLAKGDAKKDTSGFVQNA